MYRLYLIFSIFIIFPISSSATFFNTEFLVKEDLCTNPKLIDKLADTFIQIGNILYSPVPKRDVKFFLYTRKNPNRSQPLYLDEKNFVESSFFNPKVPTRILIHGFKSSYRKCLSVTARNAYLKKGEFNVIAVDWSLMASRINYFETIHWLKDVADVVNNFTTFLHRDFNVSFDDIYLIGHSIGAHLAGIAGRRLYPNKYNTIFGLDPAELIFENFKREYAIRPGDAKYVETIHTDMGLLGYKGRLGDASIYPNYGVSQKNCTKTIFGFINVPKNLPCNHVSSYIFFSQSISEPEKMTAKRCNSFKNDIRNYKCTCNQTIHPDCTSKIQIGGEPSVKKSGVFYADI